MISHQSTPFDSNAIRPMDGDLCDLLRSMSLVSEHRKEEFIDVTQKGFHHLGQTVDVHDEVMSDDSLSDTTSEYSNLSNSPTQLRNDNSTSKETKETYGCSYLQVLQKQIEIDGYPTTGGDYLEAIFTHREMFASHPASHRDCPRAFSDIAFSLERRAWRADRDADTEAVSAFRQEAWMIAAWIDQRQKEIRLAHYVLPLGPASSVCVMQPAL